AKADLLVFGMGERAVWEIARRLDAGEPIERIRDVRGTAHPASAAEAEAFAAWPSETVSDGRVVVMPSLEEVRADTRNYALAARVLHYEPNPYNARPLLQRDPPTGSGVYFNPPALPLETADMDELYDLPVHRAPPPAQPGAR